MEVFLSWSGDYSKQLAEEFRDWLPLVLQDLDPFMSKKDLLLGSRWNESINNHLESSSIGLLFVTSDNINSPWLNYEAGALTKALNSESKIIPIIFDESHSEVLLSKTPLKQFQSVINPNKEGILNLVKSLNSNLDNSLSDESVTLTFEKWWSELDNKLSRTTKNPKSSSEHTTSEANSHSSDTDINNKLLERMSQNIDFLLRETNKNNSNSINHTIKTPTDTLIIRKLRISVKRLRSAEFVQNLSPEDLNEFREIAYTLSKLVNILEHRDSYIIQDSIIHE